MGSLFWELGGGLFFEKHEVAHNLGGGGGSLRCMARARAGQAIVL